MQKGPPQILENNKFENITADPAYVNDYNGTAIYAHGGRTFASIEQTGFGKLSTNYSFDNCDYGIVTERMNVDVTETIFDDVETGIVVKHGSNRDILVQNNVINAEKNDIQLWYNDFANSIDVNYNDINFGYYAFPPVPPGGKPFTVHAIKVYETINAHDYTANIHDNYIQFLGTNSNCARGAIRLIGASEYNITDNEIYMANNLSDYTGITAMGCDNSIISCNWIRGSGAFTPSMNNSSITSFVLGNPVTINCNDFDNTYEGLVIHGPTNSNASSSLVGGNNFRNHFNALHLTSSAIIGQQIRTGNLWFNTPLTVGGTQGKNAIYDDPIKASNYEIIVNPNTSIANATPLPSSNFIEPSAWVRPDPADPTNSIPNRECVAVQYCNQFNIASNNEGELDEEVMDESINNYPYTPETIWMLQSELYARLSRDSILLNSDSLYQAFYNNMQNDNIALFENVNEELQTAYDLDPAVMLI